MPRTVPDRILELYDGPARPVHALRIISNDYGAASTYLRLYIVSDPAVITGSRLRDTETTESGNDYVTRWVPGLEGWSNVGARLNALDRTITTSAVDFVIAYSPLIAELLASTELLGKLCTLITWPRNDLSDAGAWEEVAGLWVEDIKQDGAQIVISTRDARELSRGKTSAYDWRFPDHPYRWVNAFYETSLGTGSVSLSTTASNGHLMLQRNSEQGGLAAVLQGGGIGRGNSTIAPFGVRWVQHDPTADFGEAGSLVFQSGYRGISIDRDRLDSYDIRSLVDGAMQAADASLYWPRSARTAEVLEHEFTSTPDWTLSADDFDAFEQLSTYEDVINRVLVSIPDPVSPTGLLSDFLEFDQDDDGGTSPTDLATVVLPSTSLSAVSRYKEHKIQAPDIGHQWLWPMLDANANLSRFNYQDLVKSVANLTASQTTVTLQFPELTGFAGSSSRTDTNKTLSSGTRDAWFLIYWVTLNESERGVDVSGGIPDYEIVKATAYSTPSSFTSSFNGSYEFSNPTVNLTNRLLGSVSTRPFGIYTIARGERGTTARAWEHDGERGQFLYIWDITNPMLRVDRILARNAYGTPKVRFRVNRKLGIQMEVGDKVSLSAARFLRAARPLGAGGGGTTDIFEITSIALESTAATVEATWLQGSGTVTVTERSGSGRTPRLPGRGGGPVVNPGLWSFQYSGQGQTTIATGVAGATYDLSTYFGTDDQFLTVETDWLTYWNDDPGSGGDDRISVVRVVAEISYDATGGAMTIRSQSSSIIYGIDPGHTYDYAISSSTSLQVRVTQVGSGTNDYQWVGEAIGFAVP